MAYENAPGDLRQKPQELGEHQQHNLSTYFSVEYWLQEKTVCSCLHPSVSVCVSDKDTGDANILIEMI